LTLKKIILEEDTDEQNENLHSVQKGDLSNKYGFFTKEDVILRGTTTPFIVASFYVSLYKDFSLEKDIWVGSSSMILANDGLATELKFSSSKSLK
jgi:hypothetical protein